jgi:hypothetical protein
VHNVYHGQYSGAPLGGTEANVIYQAIAANAATTAWLSRLDPDCVLTAVHVKDLRAANNPTLESTADAGHPGVSAGLAQSAGAALNVSLRTAKSGRGFFGRTYLAGITADNLVDSRHWDRAKLETASLAYVNGVKSAMAGSGFIMVVAQRALAANTDPNAPPSQQVARPANADNTVTGVKWTDDRVDSQRRRLGRS